MLRINEAFTFLFELAMLALVPVAIVHGADGLFWQISLPIAADAALIAAWAAWLAPRGPKRLARMPGVLVATVLLLLGPASLFAVGQPLWGELVGGILVVNRIAAIAAKQW